MTRQHPVPLVIVGIGCRLPGDVTSPEKFWDLLSDGKSAWSKLPTGRYNGESSLHPRSNGNKGTHNHASDHVLSQDIAGFDADFFDLLPQEAASMDRQQRLLLETTYEALESAGIPQEQIRKSNTAVYMATFTGNYGRNISKDSMGIPKYPMTGTGETTLANLLSHIFDLNGPSVTLDNTGCSGGMTAVSQACQSLRAGDCDLALAGASNLISYQDHVVPTKDKDSRSDSFDSQQSGHGREEGIATFVIKRLDDAIKARDPIRAVILDIITNRDGYTTGITFSNGAAQQALESKIWESTGVSPIDVGYDEAYGTGMPAGDDAKLDGILKVLGEDCENPIYVGSVKSNIGQLKNLSGLAAMIKAILVLQHMSIPPDVNLETERASHRIEQKKLEIPRTLTVWQLEGVPRVSINSFGYGGTNAHAILERYTRSRPNFVLEIPRLFVLSAASQHSLLSVLENTQQWLSQQPNEKLSLSDLSYTLCQRRSILPWRFSCVATTKQELIDNLERGAKKSGVTKQASDNVDLSFVFTGQGAQWAGMGRELLSYVTFRKSIYRSRDILQDLGSSWDLVEELLCENGESRLMEAELAQPSITAIQIALVDVLRSWGIVPDSVVGHSSGEIGAAYAAGYLPQHTALKIAFFSRFSTGVPQTNGYREGGMIAVDIREKDSTKYLAKAVDAFQNSPRSTTLSGDDTVTTEISELLTGDGVFNQGLDVDTAYHSHHMQAAAEEYKRGLGYIEIDSSLKPARFFSTVTGDEKTEGFDSDYWVSHLASGVRFCDALQNLVRAGQDSNRYAQPQLVLVEIGPHSALEDLARQCITGLPDQITYDYIPALIRGKGAIQSIIAMVGNIFDRGYPVELGLALKLDGSSNDASVLHNLPPYSWDHSQKFWHESYPIRDYQPQRHPYHNLLGTRMTYPPLQPAWRHLVGVQGLRWLKDHVVDGSITFPDAGYLCMVIEAASHLAKDNYPKKRVKQYRLRDLSFLKGLIIPESRTRVEVQLSFTSVRSADPSKEIKYNFSVASFTEDEHWSQNCRGSVIVEFASEVGHKSFDTLRTYEESLEILDQAAMKVVTSDDLYSELGRVGHEYGPAFSGIVSFSTDGDCAVSHIIIPDVAEVMDAQHMQPYIIHPTTLDILLHTSLSLVNHKPGAGLVRTVKIQELAISADIQNVAGEYLSAITSLTSKRFGAAEADILVFPDKGVRDSTPVISVSAIQLQSLGPENGNAQIPRYNHS
ncbi:thiolase-like protein [Xylogone sp. PMI_703]|nr:thiolase-like protein [Xylogone sp. PMI_703]